MKHIIPIVLLLVVLAFGSCGEKKLTPLEDLSGKEYDLPEAKAGTLQYKINQIHEKYGTYVLYEFEERDFQRLWTGKWRKWYAPVKLDQGGEKYVEMIVDALENKLLSKFDQQFVRRNFPYRVFIVDSLCSTSTFNKNRLSDFESNGTNSIAISNAGKVLDDWDESAWNNFETQLNMQFCLFYYPSLEVKPIDFLALAPAKFILPSYKDPTGTYPDYEATCYNSGVIKGRMGTTMLKPKPEEDFAFFVQFLTGTPGSRMVDIMTRFPLVKERGMLLYKFMKENMDTDLVKTQNNNFPDDKFPISTFN